MAMEPFLAMTAAEMRNVSTFPPKIAWMACHFSPYGTGLSNLPQELPPDSLLIVDDITPPCRHDPVLIAEQLRKCAEECQCCGILLDFQRTGCDETFDIAKALFTALPYPTALSSGYGRDLDCPVFLPPVPPSVPLEEYLFPWKSREIWLELGLDGEVLTLTEQGCTTTSLPFPEPNQEGFSDPALHCHYTIEAKENSASFTLWRNQEDIQQLLKEVETLGVTTAVGLFQELHRLAEP